MKNLLISISVGLLIALIVIVLIKVNSPMGIIMKQGFKQLNRITLIDKEKVKELETELKTIRFERDSIMKIQRQLVVENRSLYLTLDRQEQINFQLNKDLSIQRARVRDLSISQRLLLTPTQNTQLFDNLTSGSKYEPSLLLDEYFAKISVQRLAEANYKIKREKELDEENAIQQKLIENLELTTGSLKIINSNLEQVVLQCNTAMDLALEEKDQYRKLYLEAAGKTRKGLFITTGIIVVETILIVWLLSK